MIRSVLFEVNRQITRSIDEVKYSYDNERRKSREC